ncbi:hypothetical protein U1Q18_029757 [Sarracenia purpurea var. burkii]
MASMIWDLRTSSPPFPCTRHCFTSHWKHLQLQRFLPLDSLRCDRRLPLSEKRNPNPPKLPLQSRQTQSRKCLISTDQEACSDQWRDQRHWDQNCLPPMQFPKLLILCHY